MVDKPEKKYNLFECSWVDVKDWLKETDIVLVPMGSLEQHGPHLPIGCDSMGAWVVTQKAIKKANVPHTPLIWSGYSPYHMWPPESGMGTVSLRFNTAVDLAYDVSRSLIHHGFNKVIFVTGHTGNLNPLDVAMRKVKYETGAVLACFMGDIEQFGQIAQDMMENPPEEFPQWHASEVETSMVMVYEDIEKKPGLVRMDRAVREIPTVSKWAHSKLTDKMKAVGSPWFVVFKDYTIKMPLDHDEWTNSGVCGNPFKASLQKGHKIYDKISDILVDFIAELKNVKVTVKNREFVERA
jgi:creatinine amidohydrolase